MEHSKVKINFQGLLSALAIPSIRDNLADLDLVYEREDVPLIKRFFKTLVSEMNKGFNAINYEDPTILPKLEKGEPFCATGHQLDIVQFIREGLINESFVDLSQKEHYEERVCLRTNILLNFMSSIAERLPRIFGDIPINKYDRFLTITCRLLRTQYNIIVLYYDVQNDYQNHMTDLLSNTTMKEYVDFHRLTTWYELNRIGELKTNKEFMDAFMTGKTREELEKFFKLPQIENYHILHHFINVQNLNQYHFSYINVCERLGHGTRTKTQYDITFSGEKFYVYGGVQHY